MEKSKKSKKKNVSSNDPSVVRNISTHMIISIICMFSIFIKKTATISIIFFDINFSLLQYRSWLTEPSLSNICSEQRKVWNWYLQFLLNNCSHTNDSFIFRKSIHLLKKFTFFLTTATMCLQNLPNYLQEWARQRAQRGERIHIGEITISVTIAMLIRVNSLCHLQAVRSWPRRARQSQFLNKFPPLLRI